jgi:hypothetical protein
MPFVSQPLEKSASSRLTGYLLTLFLSFSAVPAFSQTSANQQLASAGTQHSASGDIGIQVKPASPPSDKKMTPAEAQELFASIDDILKWLSTDTGFAIKSKVKRELASRDQVAKYVDSKMSDDEDAKRLQRSEIVLKKFGLLPREFDLHSFLVELLKEQVAGYYDVKTKTVYLLDWLSADSQKPVLAHELTHALQDQNFDLKNWEEAKTATKSNSDDFSYDEDEASTARSAVAEGQGMVTLVDYMMRESGQTVANVPQVVAGMCAAMSKNSEFPQLERSPLMIRESLVFPYCGGLTFEGGLLQNGGKEMAFAGPFHRPPQDTHEVLDVTAYLHSQPAQWIVMPDLKKELGSGYEKYDEGSVGQLDTRIMLEQYGDKDEADDMADAWRGGAYYAAGNKDPKVVSTARIGLAYLSRWDSAEAADEFAAIYGDYLPKRYAKVKALKTPEHCQGGGCDSISSFETDEGMVTIRRLPGARVLIMEGFPPEIASKVEQKVLTANPDKTITVERHSLMSPLRTSAAIQQAIGGVMTRIAVAEMQAAGVK